MADLNWQALAGQYRTALLDDVVPFWLRHSLDHECGGYLHHLDRQGGVWCTEKMMWMQGRQVWTFSRLCNAVERRDEWLAAARLGAEFMRRHGRDENGDWYFLLDRQGAPIKVAYNIFSDFFAVLGLGEYAAASGEEWALDMAVETFWRIVERRDNPKGRWNKLLPRPDTPRDHAFPMIMLSVARQLNEHAPDERIADLADEALRQITTSHIDPERRAVFENVWPDSSRPDTPAGRLLNPGHGIESMRFVMDAAPDQATFDRAVEALLWTLERGWDSEHGGVFYFLDMGGRPPEQLEWSMKLWWPHTEALIALMMAHARTGRADLAEWYRRVHGYTWALFPDPEHGEWFGYFDRAGNRTHDLKGSKWKGCFHVPRALLTCWQITEKMSTGERTA